jgi:uncharacterized protein (UPF0264 family)
LLVSVRTVDEALLAARNGADFIDLKEPRDGALGGLPVATVRAIVAALRAQGCRLLVSATIGDLPASERATILRQVAAVGACGVDYVKVGIERAPDAAGLLRALAASGWPVVPVFIADRGLEPELVACAHGFPALMADTADKRCGSLFDAVPLRDLHDFVARVRRSGALVGLAGALRLHHLPALAALAPDFAGFRSAVCAGDRGSPLDAELLRELAGRLHDPASEMALP